MRIAALALVGAAAVVLAGCTPTGHPTATPKPSATPVFTSDAAALKAAEKAFARYLAASDEVAQKGGVDLGPIKSWVTPAQLVRETSEYAYYTDHKIHSSGSSTITNTVLEAYTSSGRAARVSAYFCVDVSGVRILDTTGADVTSADRPSKTPLEVTLQSAATHSKRLLVDSSSQWSGSGVC